MTQRHAARASAPPAADPGIQARIAAALPRLTGAQRQLAEFVNHELFRAATMRIEEIAQAAGVSAASANRFARALGFDGYPQFRAAMVREFQATMAPVERLRDALASPASSHDVVLSALETDIDNLRATQRTLTGKACNDAVGALVAARRVYVLGFGSSAQLAAQLEYGLTPYLGDVQSLATAAGPANAARRLHDLGAKDVVVSIAFPRYLRDTVALTRIARDNGARVLALTDTPSSPLARLAHTTLLINAYRRMAANSDAVVLSVIQGLCGAVAHRVAHSAGSAASMTQSTLPWLYQETGQLEPEPAAPNTRRAP